MTTLYPLRFAPLLKRYLWGGRRLETVLGKSLPEGSDFAESWEIADHQADQSLVSAGPLRGLSLGELVQKHGHALLGRHAPQPRFPLLFKYLDSSKVLSVQVHPNDAAAALLNPPDLGKTEAWLVVHAEPGAAVYTGLKAGFDRSAVERETRAGTVERCLNRLEPRAGDCLFIPAGVVHALGAGFVIAEIQQASNTTFRLHDWNRMGPDGKPRALHIDESLSAIDYEYGPVTPQTPQATDRPHVERLVACDKFVLDRWQFSWSEPVGGDDRFHILTVLHGAVELAGDPVACPLTKGQTILLPASLPSTQARPLEPTIMLDMYLP
jgi:mannose-6-phosphate isomerase